VCEGNTQGKKDSNQVQTNKGGREKWKAGKGQGHMNVSPKGRISRGNLVPGGTLE